jgi:radical SAM protein with 4Fe4S-binding SPASM domain
MEKNVEELADMVKLAIDLGVDRVKGHHLWVNSSEMKNENMRRNSDSIKKWNCAVAKTLEIANGKNIILENIFELNENAGDELIQDSGCPFLGQEAWFNTKGDFNPCCAPNDLRKGLGNFGNINEKTFFEIWNSREYKELCENYKNIELCKKCNMRRIV